MIFRDAIARLWAFASAGLRSRRTDNRPANMPAPKEPARDTAPTTAAASTTPTADLATMAETVPTIVVEHPPTTADHSEAPRAEAPRAEVPPAEVQPDEVQPDEAGSEPNPVAPLHDPDFDKLLARSAKLQAQKVDLGARLADMERTVRAFEQRQYSILNEVLSECLRLRAEYARLKADHSGDAADLEAARSAEQDFESYASSGEARADEVPELDGDEREDLRRLYRAAASRCHPDRATEAQREAAHARFLQVQEAYRANDLQGLRNILAALEETGSSPTDPISGVMSHAMGSEPIRRQVGALQNEVADLILAIQTLQLDNVYRQATWHDDWDDYFDRARRGFEDECATLRSRIRLHGLGIA